MRTGLVVSAGLLWVPLWTQAGVSSGITDDTGLRFWRLEDRGISFELVQRLPDQTRAFFQARGFSAEQANAIALGCVFQSIFRNRGATGSGAVAYDLADWVVLVDGTRLPVMLKEKWDRRWQESGVVEPARIAFRWSFLPTRQRYEPGDYNWGMTSYGLPPGATFDLDMVWNRDGDRETARIRDIECAPDLRSLSEDAP
jgi:hypothetical protein